MPIYDYLRGYCAYRFHTPGHKGGLDVLDITEIDGEFPGDIITVAEGKTARLYGADNLRYLVNGSSIGMKAAILAACGDIVSESYRHRCVDEGAALAGYKLITIPETSAFGADALPVMPTAETVTESLKVHSSAAAAVIQYPDYYGRCVDIESIYAAVKNLGKLLILDSAHGAHFAFCPDIFPKSATLFSDACNLSAHKTLCAYTQTAYLAFDGKMKKRGIEKALETLGTTSPNYVFLAQLEKAADDAAGDIGNYYRIKKKADVMRELLPCLENDDCTRFVLDCRNLGGGEKVFRTLRIKGITAERFDENYVIFIFTPADSDAALDNLTAELKNL